MINIPYLLKTLKTTKLSELVANIDLPPLDVNLLLWDAEKNGQIKIDVEKDKVKILAEPEVTFNPDLSNKLIRWIQHYAEQEINISRGRLNQAIKDPITGAGYGYHDYITALQYLIDSGQVEEVAVKVPKDGERPSHTFSFLQLPENPNEEWNKREVNKWIENWNKTR
jgi:hypothetical protein